MPSLKVLIIANACQWASWPGKIAAIKAFYAPLVDLQIDIKYTDYQNIPLGSYPGSVTQFGPDGAHDVPGNDLQIDQEWFNTIIGPQIAGYDVAVFQAANVAATGLPLGIKFEELNGTWCAETFVQNETFDYILPNPDGSGQGINLGNEAEIIIEHEIAHALYSISGQQDNTHLYFYANQFPRVLTDIKLPNQSVLVGLYQKLIADLQEELGILKQQQAVSDPATLSETAETKPGATEPQTSAQSSFPPKITAWAQIVGKEEGANPALNNPGNLKYSTLTASWGGTPGPVAKDGGNLCQFKTLQAGQNALCQFLVLGCEDELVAFHTPAARTLEGFTVVYAGNPPAGYINAIVTAMGGDPNVQISSFLA